MENNRKSINLLDESLDEFQQNFKMINENKLKLANISKYLVPKISSEDSSKEKEEIVDKKQKKESSKISKYFSTKNDIQSPPVKNKFNCPLCDTELTDEDEQNRQLHVNKCLDKFSKTKIKTDETAPVTSKTDEDKKALILASKENADKKLSDLIRNEGIPNCPICGKIAQTLNVCIF
jgi:predicted RNA-binding Zn-ribbon protein involved in translation (DUF1610 family)